MSKKKIKYTGGELPQNISELLNNADEQDLKILVLLLMSADESGEIAEELSIEEILGISKNELDASLKFWRGAGIVGSLRTAKKKNSEPDLAEANSLKTEIPTAHKNGALESNGVENYNSLELAILLEKREVTACFIDEAQRVFGKTFRTADTNIVVGLVDQYGFEEEAILALLAYCFRIGKKSVRYVEKLAIGFYDEGITSGVDTIAKITEIEQSKEVFGKLKRMFGFGSRELSKIEQELFKKWVFTYGYELDEIRIAYNITVDRINKAEPKYTDKIIENWYKNGIHGIEKIEESERNKKGDQGDGNSQKSYKVDEFFEAAMKRSFDDLK